MALPDPWPDGCPPPIIARRWTVCAYCRKVRRDPTEYCPGCGW